VDDDGAVLILSSSSDEGEEEEGDALARPAADGDGDAVMVLSSSSSDEEEGEEVWRGRGGARPGPAPFPPVPAYPAGGLAAAALAAPLPADEEEEEQAASLSVPAVVAALGGKAFPLPRPALAAAVARLSPAQRAAALAALAPGHDAAPVATHPRANITLTKGLAACLKGRAWLNDEVVNTFVALLQDRDLAARRAVRLGGGRGSAAAAAAQPTPPPPRCYFLVSFFMNKLYADAGEYAYGGVRRWTAPARLARVFGGRGGGGDGKAARSPPLPPAVDPPPACILTACDAIILPLHLAVHWAVAVIDLRGERLEYWDSMGGPAPAGMMDALGRWVTDEAADKLADPAAAARFARAPAWPVVCRAVPRQGNGADCGVFALRFAECAARGVGPDFTQADMDALRLVMAADCVAHTVSPVPPPVQGEGEEGV
jgi:hypothetical protein